MIAEENASTSDTALESPAIKTNNSGINILLARSTPVLVTQIGEAPNIAKPDGRTERR